MTYVRTYGSLLGDFWMQRDVINDYDKGDSWIYACDNQTGVTVCNCACEKLPPGPCQSLNTSGWTFLGDDGSCDGTNPHDGCSKWAHLKSKAEDEEEYYWVTRGAPPNLLQHALIYAPESLFNQSENVTHTELAPPPPETWAIPAVWQCITPHGPVTCENASSASSNRGRLPTVADTARMARELVRKA